MPQERQISFDSNGEKLSGIVHEPAGTGRSIGIILLNGWGGYHIGPHRIYVKTSRALVAQGFHVLRFDFRGTGDSEGSLANVTEADVNAFVNNSRAAIDFMRQRYQLKHWYLLGLCTGGEIAAIYASSSNVVHGLILWSTASHFNAFRAEQPSRRLSHYLRVYFRKLILRSTWQRLLSGKVHVQGITHTLFADFGAASHPTGTKPALPPYRNLFVSLQGPVLLAYGTADPHAKSSALFFEERLKEQNIPYSLHLIEGADASFSARQFEAEVLAITCNWLISTSSPEHSIPLGLEEKR